MNRRSWFAALFAAPVAVIAGMRGAGKPKLQELRVALNLDTSRFSAGMGRVEAYYHPARWREVSSVTELDIGPPGL